MRFDDTPLCSPFPQQRSVVLKERGLFVRRAACHLGVGTRLLFRDKRGEQRELVALSLLSADGLVERVEQRGFRVAEVNSSEFEELLAIRCSIETSGTARPNSRPTSPAR